MNDDAHRVRREIIRLKHDRRPTAVRYPLALRRKVIALARRRQTRGVGLVAIARELIAARWQSSFLLKPSRAQSVGCGPS